METVVRRPKRSLPLLAAGWEALRLFLGLRGQERGDGESCWHHVASTDGARTVFNHLGPLRNRYHCYFRNRESEAQRGSMPRGSQLKCGRLQASEENGEQTKLTVKLVWVQDGAHGWSQGPQPEFTES